jgi:hypothetical protein
MINRDFEHINHFCTSEAVLLVLALLALEILNQRSACHSANSLTSAACVYENGIDAQMIVCLSPQKQQYST